MIPRLARQPDPAPRTTDLVDGWLRVFIGLLKLPTKQAAAIREELEGHLRERVRDLMLSGQAEGEATKQAIAELGEAADVAARYRAVRSEPRRRLIMHAMLFTVTGAALALSVAAFRGGGQPPRPEQKPADPQALVLQQFLAQALAPRQSDQPMAAELLSRAALGAQERQDRPELERLIRNAIPQPTGSTATYVPQALPSELEELRVDWDIQEQNASSVFEYLGTLAKLPVQPRWNLLSNSNFQADTNITFKAKQAGVGGLLRAINETAEVSGGRSIDIRVTDGVLEVAPREYFDRREMELVSYDLSGIIAARIATYSEEREKIVENVLHVIGQFVNPEQWRDNGGDLAEMSVVGDRLFVQAPRRFHPQIRWILSQLPTGGEKHSQAAPAKEGAVIERYACKHVGAAEARQVLARLDSIRKIDFSDVTADAQTNSLIFRGPAAQQAMFKIALETLDRPADRRSATPPENQSGTIYLTGEVRRAGVYAISADGISVRRLLAAAGGANDGARIVTISDSKDGQAVVLQEIPVAELAKDDGPDPMLKQGQLVSVK